MVSDKTFFEAMYKAELVLILVLMEDGLWHSISPNHGINSDVLILVLMEDGLWQTCGIDNSILN